MNQIAVQIARTFGVEIECEDVAQEEIGRSPNFNFTHDASILSDVVRTRNGLIFEDSKNIGQILPYSRYTIGAELASAILDSESDSSFNSISELTYKLMQLGESFESQRSGIHFHISLPSPSLRILKSLLRIGRYLEQVFFNIGGMGYQFRGVYNESIYCRPITEYGPVCIPYSGTSAQVFNLKDLLQSKSIEEFWEKYGDCYNHSGLRYNPVRYHWLNLYPMFPTGEYRGTVEFRLFNKTLNPYYIWSALQLCKKFVEYSIYSSFSSIKDDGLLGTNSIYSSYTKDEVIELLYKFAEISELERVYLKDLLYIIQRTPVVRLESTYVRTHISRDLNRYWYGSKYTPTLVARPKKVVPVDIHYLRGETR